MSENSLTLPRRYARFSWITRMFITAIIIFINRFSMSCLPVSVAARLSVEAIGRLELLRPRRDEVGLSTDPCWPQRSISMLLPLILPTLSWRKQKSRDDVTQLDFFYHLLFYNRTRCSVSRQSICWSAAEMGIFLACPFVNVEPFLFLLLVLRLHYAINKLAGRTT